MVYLEYEIETGYVIDIHEEEPSYLEDGMAIAKSTHFKKGDEFEYLIIVNEVDKDGLAKSISKIKQARSYSRILKENNELKQRLELIQQALDELILGEV